MNTASPQQDLDELLDSMARDPYWLAHIAAGNAKMAGLEPFLRAQYPRLLKLCRYITHHDEKAKDIVQEGIRKFLREIFVELRVGSPTTIVNAAYIFRKPEAWLTRVVRNTLYSSLRKQSSRLAAFKYAHELPLLRLDDVTRVIGLDEVARSSETAANTPTPERHLLDREQRASDRAFVKHYRAALPLLSLPRRRAWVLCNDKFLHPDEAEKLLKLKSARAARAAWPEGMPIKEAARLLRCAEGTVSSNVSRARDDLRRELADLDPLQASRAPVGKWHEFLGSPFGVRGSLEQIVFAVTPFLGPLPLTLSAGPVIPARSARDLIIDYARAIHRPLPLPANHSEPAQEIEHDSRPRRANLPFPKGLKRIAYRCGSYMKGCRNCGETKRIRTKKGRKKTVYTSGYAVFRAYAPNETGWSFWCYECGARDEQCWANCYAELGSAALIRPKSELVYKDSEKEPGHDLDR